MMNTTFLRMQRPFARVVRLASARQTTVSAFSEPPRRPTQYLHNSSAGSTGAIRSFASSSSSSSSSRSNNKASDSNPSTSRSRSSSSSSSRKEDATGGSSTFGNEDGDVNNQPEEEPVVFERTVYVHPLSQIILEYFQNAHHDWIVAQGLDAALTLHRDGSFELKFPTNPKAENNNEIAQDEADGQHPQYHRIWTSYDEMEKQHWLTVYRGPNLPGQRFLLQDNLLPAWNNNRKSLPERIHVSVDEMVRLVNLQRVA